MEVWQGKTLSEDDTDRGQRDYGQTRERKHHGGTHMGTYATFWIGDPRDEAQREWLGGIAWNGYTSGPASGLAAVTSETEFRAVVHALSTRQDFAAPEHGWPYPWADDIFLTDYTYAWMGGHVMVTSFHAGFLPLRAVLTQAVDWDDDTDLLPHDVQAPCPYNPRQPDSIILLRRR
jgi:hypothetical protein